MASPTEKLDGTCAPGDLGRPRDILAEVCRLVSYRYDLPETINILLEHLRSVLQVDLLALALADEQKNTLRLRYSCSTAVVCAELPPELPFNDSPSGAACFTQEIVVIDEVASDRRWPRLLNPLRAAHIATYCSIPLIAGDRPLGALSLGSLAHHAYSAQDRELLRQISIPVAMAVENERIREFADRYTQDVSHLRDHAGILLRISSTLAEQPTLQAVIHSLRGVLANISGVHSAALYLLNEDGKSLKLCAFDNAPDGPNIPLGTEVPRTSVFARVLAKHEPEHLPELASEMLNFPQLAPLASAVGPRAGYVFPVATSRKQYGAIAFSGEHGSDFAADDVELMGSLASHVAIAVEAAVSIDAAKIYQRELAEQRDRLSLLLEVNNHIVSKLEAKDLFDAVAASMRKHFGNDLTSLWLLNKQTGSLERKYLDFPTSKGFVEKTPSLLIGALEREILSRRTPQIYSGDFAGLPAATREACQAEAIQSVVVVPLGGANGPLGALAMSTRSANAFRESDLELLSQIGTQISLILDNALAYGKLRKSRDELEDQKLYLEAEIRAEYNFEQMIGNSPAWRRVLHQITTVAPTDAGVLLLGETGTGKELIARAIHSRSHRRDRTLVKLSCAAVPTGLLESELFGHEKGAFTGALSKQIGRFELANKGTLFLDEVGDIPLELQTKLLRGLQEQEFERLGNPHTIKVDVRVIAATNRDLSQMVKDKAFRQDLYYRLNVFPIVVPPLRERADDIEMLVVHFVGKYAARMRKPIESIPAAAMKVLRKYQWPGNVRELEHVIERAVILSPGNVLQVPIEELLGDATAARIPTLEQGEREQILQALRACGGVIGGPNGAASRLAINRSTLNSRMRKLGIARSDI